uniref:Uncharacterized protein n=1 Tax=Anopheles albimanus TaxID=7167 RepID=A0A182FZD0_ANOAL
RGFARAPSSRSPSTPSVARWVTLIWLFGWNVSRRRATSCASRRSSSRQQQ